MRILEHPAGGSITPLQDHVFKDKLGAEINVYMETNVPTAPSAGTARDARKAPGLYSSILCSQERTE